MNYETKQLDELYNHISPSQGKQRISDITRDSQSCRLSQLNQSPKSLQNQKNQQNISYYRKFFQQKVKQEEVNNLLHKKAINWLITFCWTRNYSQEILWYSIGYYYAYIFFYQLKKQRLTLLLMTAVNISLKLNSTGQKLSFDQMLNLLNNKFTKSDLLLIQNQIIKLFNFDLYFYIQLDKIYLYGQNQQEIAKTLFIYQMLFFKNYDVTFNTYLIEDILSMIRNPQKENQIKKDIIMIGLNSKIIQPLKQKFLSKFDVNMFLEQLSIDI